MTPPGFFLGVLFLLPLGMMALYAFRDGSFGEASQTFTLRHFQTFFSNADYLRLLWRSVLLSFWVSWATVLLAYPLAYYLIFYTQQNRLLLLTLIIVPAWVSYLLRVLAWKVILGPTGVLAAVFAWLNMAGDGTSFFLYSPTAVTITLIYVWVPFVALPIFVALERIDYRLLEAAADLGCTQTAAFFRVTLPLSLPGVLAGFLFVFIPTVGEYVTPALVGGPDGIMIGNLIQDQFLRGLNWPMGALMSLVVLVVIMLPLVVFGRFIRVSDVAGAM